MADLGRARGSPPPPPPLRHINSFDFMQFLEKFGKIVCWRPPPLGELAPPPRGNPGSASAVFYVGISYIDIILGKGTQFETYLLLIHSCPNVQNTYWEPRPKPMPRLADLFKINCHNSDVSMTARSPPWDRHRVLAWFHLFLVPVVQ